MSCRGIHDKFSLFETIFNGFNNPCLDYSFPDLMKNITKQTALELAGSQVQLFCIAMTTLEIKHVKLKLP